MLTHFHPDVRIITKAPGASPDSIAALRSKYPQLPDDAAELMAAATEIEIDYRGRYLRLYGPDGSSEADEAYGITAHIPHSVVLGDNGGSEAILFIPERGVCRVGHGALDIDEAIYITDSLTSLLVKANAAPEAVGGVEA